MKATITIDMDNAAFDGRKGRELARILRQLAGTVGSTKLRDSDDFKLRDINGNTVGTFVVSK